MEAVDRVSEQEEDVLIEKTFGKTSGGEGRKDRLSLHMQSDRQFVSVLDDAMHQHKHHS